MTFPKCEGCQIPDESPCMLFTPNSVLNLAHRQAVVHSIVPVKNMFTVFSTLKNKIKTRET